MLFLLSPRRARLRNLPLTGGLRDQVPEGEATLLAVLRSSTSRVAPLEASSPLTWHEPLGMASPRGLTSVEGVEAVEGPTNELEFAA